MIGGGTTDVNGLLRRAILDIQEKYIKSLASIIATGKSVNSLRVEIEHNKATLFGGHWLPYIDVGRGKTRSATGELKSAIFLWAQAVGVEDYAYAIYRQIATEGTRTRLQNREIVSGVDIEPEIDKLVQSFREVVSLEVRKAYISRNMKGIKITHKKQ